MDLKDVETPHGRPAQFYCRTWTSDLATVGATNRLWGKLIDEYHIPERLTGWALDIGAHIGSVTVPLLLDNPGLRVVAIEAVPDNTQMLRRNLELNGVADRCIVMSGAAWHGKGTVDVEFGYTGSEIATTHAWIGSVTPWIDNPGTSERVGVPILTLKDALAVTDGEFVWVKSDCEGCEHHFLKGPLLKRLAYITGEWHHRDGTPEAFTAQLSKTHDIEWSEGVGGGPFTAIRR